MPAEVWREVEACGECGRIFQVPLRHLFGVKLDRSALLVRSFDASDIEMRGYAVKRNGCQF